MFKWLLNPFKKPKIETEVIFDELNDETVLRQLYNGAIVYQERIGRATLEKEVLSWMNEQGIKKEELTPRQFEDFIMKRIKIPKTQPSDRESFQEGISRKW